MVATGVFDGVRVSLGVNVSLGVSVIVAVSVAVGVDVIVAVSVCVGVNDGCTVFVAVAVDVAVEVTEGLSVAEGDTTADGVTVVLVFCIAAVANPAFKIPAPHIVVVQLLTGNAVTFARIIARISVTVAEGLIPYSNAATPATCGAAMLVP